MTDDDPADTDPLLAARLRETALSVEVDNRRARSGPLAAVGAALLAFGVALVASSADDTFPIIPSIGGTLYAIAGSYLVTKGGLSIRLTASRSDDLIQVRGERIRLERSEEIARQKREEVRPGADAPRTIVKGNPSLPSARSHSVIARLRSPLRRQ